MYANPLAEHRETHTGRSWPPAATRSRTAMIRRLQEEQGEEPCFRTERRLLCGQTNCRWRSECRRLVAAWKR